MARAAHRLLSLFLILCVHGCARPVTRVVPVPPGTSGILAAPGPAVSRTIASVETKRGRLDVIDDGRGARSITILGQSLHRTRLDPMADLVSRILPEPRRVLLVGLGTGQLSVELARRGMRVDVLEQDAVVARSVCEHLGCAGEVVVDDAPWSVVAGQRSNPALPHLGALAAASSVVYDAVIVDEEVASYPKVVSHATDLEGVRLSPTALVARRYRRSSSPPASDADSEPPQLFVGQREDESFDEIRVLMGMPEPLDGAGLHVWPPQQTIDVLPGQSGAEKTIRVFGYLVKTSEGDTVLELPHDRAGAVVVFLRGALAERELAPRAPPGVRFRDVLAEDPWKSDELMMPLLGPGHRRVRGRSVVASGVAVALRGTARFVVRGPVPNDRERRSGTSYELEVESVERVLDRAAWAPIEARHLARLEAARVAVAKSDWGVAAGELDASVVELRSSLGPDADHCQWIHATENVATALRQVNERGLLASCASLTRFSPTYATSVRPVPHPADIALYREVKKVTDGTLLRLAQRRGASREIEQAAGCWWDSTFHDPDFPNAIHLEISRRFPGVAQPVLD